MVKRYRDVSEKYRSFRLTAEAIYSSRTIQTLFNKFTKKGKKAKARKHIARALSALRLSGSRRPRIYNIILHLLRDIRIHFILVAKRQGRNTIEVPTPIRRNQRDIINLQTLYTSVSKRRERGLYERLEQELLALTKNPEQSTTLKQRSASMHRAYEERVWINRRWR